MTATARSARRRRPRTLPFPAAAAALLLLSLPLAKTAAQAVLAPPFVTLGSEAEERLRLRQLLGQYRGDDFMIRSASRLTAFASPADTTSPYGIILPEVHVVHNSALPFSLGNGPLWASVGWNESITTGLVMRDGPVVAIVAPTLLREQNAPFQAIPYSSSVGPPRSRWANPFHPLPESIDLPLRFGDKPIERLDLGQSSVTIDARGVGFGAGTENLWWGPGIRDAITLSNNAPGFPHLFVQTRRPVHTRAGTFDAQWILGQLSESAFFDTIATNDKRSLSGVVVNWATPFDSTLSLGVARFVMATQDNGAFRFSSAFDVLRSAGHLDADTTKPVPSLAKTQITSLFARWLFPGAGLEAYAEWARFEEPRSLRDFLEFPGHSEGYTLGFQWARPVFNARTFRLQSEVSYLEPDPSLRLRWTPTTYTSRAVPQGFTNQGMTLGAAIGPGSSAQWIAGDVFAPRWRFGAYLGRVRWDNGLQFEPIVPGPKFADVTLLGGLRGSLSWRGTTLLVDFTHAARFYYLFQAYVFDPATNKLGGIDLLNNTLSVSLSSSLPFQ
jgi:hypothetical protein